MVQTKEALKPISQLKIGDIVFAYNEQTGDFDWYPITAVWIEDHDVIVYLVIDGELIITTPEHPFFTENLSQVSAGNLQVGDTIWRGILGSGRVEAVLFVSQPQVMYNLTVDQAHTFFVGAGRWLVHNDCGKWEKVNEAMSSRARKYQEKITGKSGEAWVQNGVKYDGISNGILLDAKGPGYAKFVKNGEFRSWFRGKNKLLSQAAEQIRASNGMPITWHVKEKKAADAMRNLLQSNGHNAINVIHTCRASTHRVEKMKASRMKNLFTSCRLCYAIKYIHRVSTDPFHTMC